MQIQLERDAGRDGRPVYRQIADHIRREIEADRFALGSRLTPIRDLAKLPLLELDKAIKDMERQMKQAAKDLEFEKAALLRDEIMDLRGVMALRSRENSIEPLIFEN